MDNINGTGRRKTAIARVILKKGSGKLIVNGKSLDQYCTIAHLKDDILRPLQALEAEKTYDVFANVKGGGIKGQAQAIQLGLARALIKENEEYQSILKSEKLLTRDSRKVERKKPGLRKARKKEQYSKR